MVWLVILKIAFLFLGFWWTFVTVSQMVMKQKRIPAENFFLASVGVVGFIVMHFKLYL